LSKTWRKKLLWIPRIRWMLMLKWMLKKYHYSLSVWQWLTCSSNIHCLRGISYKRRVHSWHTSIVFERSWVRFQPSSLFTIKIWQHNDNQSPEDENFANFETSCISTILQTVEKSNVTLIYRGMGYVMWHGASSEPASWYTGYLGI
jgi:hypothetical protein